jgi:hypothetical protein
VLRDQLTVMKHAKLAKLALVGVDSDWLTCKLGRRGVWPVQSRQCRREWAAVHAAAVVPAASGLQAARAWYRGSGYWRPRRASDVPG